MRQILADRDSQVCTRGLFFCGGGGKYLSALVFVKHKQEGTCVFYCLTVYKL